MARFDSAQRARLLAAAIPVFADQGLEGTTIRQVGQAAGVNAALLYYYFENKHTLFVEAVRLVIRGLLDHLNARRQAFATGRQRLAFLVDGLFEYYGTQPARLKLMGVVITLHGDLLGQVIQDLVQERVVLPVQTLQEGMALGQLQRRHPAQVWWSVLGMCLFSLQVRAVTKHVDASALHLPWPDLPQARNDIIDLLCDGLVPASRRSQRKPKSAR
jgi:TetR/AcrR family transcriptional regulator